MTQPFIDELVSTKPDSTRGVVLKNAVATSAPSVDLGKPTSSELRSTAQDVRKSWSSLVARDITNTPRNLEGSTSAKVDDLPRISGMQKWNGRVVAAQDDVLTIELTPVNEEGPTVYADFKRDVFLPDDRAEVSVGSTVYVTVRHVRAGKKKPRIPTASVRLARLRQWTSEEVDSLWAEAQRRSRSLSVHAD